MNNHPESTKDFSEICLQKGMRPTPQRQAIFEALMDDRSHPNAASLYKRLKSQMPSLSFDTVNRTLILFATHGLLHEIDDHGRAKRYDPFCDQHHHFHCRSCGEIQDIRDERLDRFELPDNLDSIGKADRLRLSIEGSCAKCIANKIR